MKSVAPTTNALNNPLKYTDPTGYQTAAAPGAISWLGGGGGWGENGRGFGRNVNWDYFANMNRYTNWQGRQVTYMDTPDNIDPGADDKDVITIFGEGTGYLLAGIISRSISLSDLFDANSITIGVLYPEPWSSVIINGRHVGEEIINITLGHGVKAGGEVVGGINTINNISNAVSFTANAIKYSLQYTKVGGTIGYTLSYSKAFLKEIKSLNPVGNIAGMITTGFAYYKIANGSQQSITYLDATVGTVGLSAQIASYYSGIEIPYVGEFVAIYGTLRLFYDLGQTYGPSTWYGENDYKWFE